MKAWSRPDVPSLDPDPRLPRLFNTAAGEVVEVGPSLDADPSNPDGRPEAARLYVCGITPYDATHLGHANTYVTFDLLKRTWMDAGLRVVYTQNVTDVDDPLLERAEATGVDWEDLAAEQVQLFRTDMEALRVIPPTHYIGAVESIPLVLDLIHRLIASGLVYQLDDPEHPDWYFSSSEVPHFGKVSGVDREAALAIFGERGGDPGRPGKRDPLDCLVWRMERVGEPAWDSELGHGRPGWHIECTAIALGYLGTTFDVQGGGRDLAFPHHEMCAAEGRAATGARFARAYVHGGMVGYGGEKMSKSKGNLVLVSKLLEQGADPMAIRLALLAHHYRGDWEYTDADLARANERLARWRAIANNATAFPAGETVQEIRDALRDDLDAPRALAAVDAWAAASESIDSDETGSVDEVLTLVDALLGVRV